MSPYEINTSKKYHKVTRVIPNFEELMVQLPCKPATLLKFQLTNAHLLLNYFPFQFSPFLYTHLYKIKNTDIPHAVMMALQVCAAAPRTTMVRNSAWLEFITKRPTVVCATGDYPVQLVKGKHRGTNFGLRLKCSSDAVTTLVEVGQVTEVDKDTFWPIVKAAGDKTVVVDMYTQWCGPCKLMAPKYAKLSEEYTDVVFLKLDCNQENKPLAKELGIKVVPTFKILKDSKIVKVITGAKFDDLVGAIEDARAL